MKKFMKNARIEDFKPQVDPYDSTNTNPGIGIGIYQRLGPHGAYGYLSTLQAASKIVGLVVADTRHRKTMR